MGYSQLPLSVIMTVIAVTAPAFRPGLLDSFLFQLGLLLHVLILAMCFTVPWHRLPPGTVLTIPLCDFVAIAVSRAGAGDLLPGLGVLAVFPVIWLSASGMAPRTSVLLSILGPFLIVMPSALAGFPQVSATDLTSLLLFPLMMLAVSLAIHSASANIRQQKKQLLEKDRQFRMLLSESSKRERLLETILDTVDVGIVAVDADGRHILRNRRQRQFDRLSSPERLRQQPGKEQSLVFGEDKVTPLPAERLPIRRAVQGESFRSQLVWLGENEGQRAISVAARAMTDETGDFAGSVIVFSDVTEYIEALSAKDDFVASVTHELHTPLTSILGHLDLVVEEEGALPPEVIRHLGVVQRNAERLLSLVSDLLVTASGTMNVRPRRTNLAEVVEISVGSAGAHASSAGITVRNLVPDPLWVYADPARIGQVLDNLLSNAIKYSPDGGTVELTAFTSEGTVKLEVKDTGMGMSPAEAEAAFSRFFRAAKARESGIPGVGLGLSVTKTIVENHGGAITCISSLGEGTTFTVALPASPADAPSDAIRSGR
ncbi:sensor histidine kinase [Crystallibacter crystallopoietes]|uniref:sensor histidine kinase n=1 Tax=Crystallibacter crystallopoietes TaxID=37928 RepID=UPI001ED988F2|nr:PAS domain-containing sensor histidine kinase [Arthrobacter crystallopoietes]